MNLARYLTFTSLNPSYPIISPWYFVCQRTFTISMVSLVNASLSFPLLLSNNKIKIKEYINRAVVVVILVKQKIIRR